MSWTFDNIPDQTGRTAIITGANTGLGFETARMLAQRGAHVVLACRNLSKGSEALRRILELRPSGSVTLESLDLSDLGSIASFAQKTLATQPRIDLLINNAGVMVPPRGKTAQGFELQFGTNHLGHFALTAPLLPRLAKQPGARVVVVASMAQRFGSISIDDPNWEHRRYNGWLAYGQSKLANMMFALELQRRLAAAGSGLIATAAHPGWTATDLQRSDPMSNLFNPLLAMPVSKGALTTLRAATEPSVKGGSYSGPTGFAGMWGESGEVSIPSKATDADIASKLWAKSEELTGARYDFSAPGG